MTLKICLYRLRMIILPGLLSFLFSCKHTPPKDYSGWTAYAGAKDGNRYSSDTNINRGNVSKLQVAWTYSTHDKDQDNGSQNQCNPIMVEGILFGVSPKLKLFAADAATGKQKWIFDPFTDHIPSNKDSSLIFAVSRGVMYWQDEKGTDKRIIYSVGQRTYAINATNGNPIRTFGKSGYIDLSENLDREPNFNPFVAGSTPGIVYKDIFIQGMRLTETADAAPGHIRAFDIRTGERRWIFHTIPYPGEAGYDTWPDKEAYRKIGGANNWAGMSLDEERGILYVPTGSIGGDFYGGIRKGQNLYANSLIALDAETGKYLWHFQTVHHDLWDRDLPANPNLVTLHKDEQTIDAVAQITKQGYIFLFDRVSGKPIFPVNEKPVPQGALPGEEPWPTQPVPSLPEPFARQIFGPEDVSDLSPEIQKDMMEKFSKIKYLTPFTPPSKEGSWIFPGFDGGGEWGGAAVDIESGILYVNCTELPWSLIMIDAPKSDLNDRSVKGIGMGVYNRYCISCHGPNLQGNGTSYPSLVNLEKKYNKAQARKIIENGRNMMPAFKQISESEKETLLSFLLNLQEKHSGGKDNSHTVKTATKEPGREEALHFPVSKTILDDVPYIMTGYNRFLDKNQYPGIKPPWGTLNAVNLNTGKLLWKVPLGEYPELTKNGIPITGTENYGGPLVTKGGLVFIAATKDEKIRAFDKKTGKVLWEAPLPAAGFATPATYILSGKQYVVIACGGGKVGNKSGDQYVAFALP